jgi:hypothetical protein
VFPVRISYEDGNTLFPIIVFLSGEGPRSRRYGRTAALRLLVQPCDEDDDDDDDYFCPFPCNGAPVE